MLGTRGSRGLTGTAAALGSIGLLGKVTYYAFQKCQADSVPETRRAGCP
jgi:uncharacterized membrane protein YebE (DUF533 family)